MDKRTTLSTLWIVVMMNMIFADILSFISPNFFDNMSAMTITPMMLLIFALLLEVPIMMIYLSRVLDGAALKWTTLAASILTILFVIGGGSLAPHYIFFASVEVIVMLIILVMAWRLQENPEYA